MPPPNNVRTPKVAARRILVVWDDGSSHHFTRVPETHAWALTHTPPEIEGAAKPEPLDITGYDQFQLTRVLVNCVDGDA